MYQRFTKQDINNTGWKLGLLDVNILGRIYDNEAKIAKVLKEHKIRPVISMFISSEWIKGLENPNIAHDPNRLLSLKNQKIQTIRFLENHGLLWIFLLPNVLAIEHLNIRRKNSLAHSDLHIFADKLIVGDPFQGACIRAKNNKSLPKYKCDRGLKYGFMPTEAIILEEDYGSAILTEQMEEKHGIILKRGAEESVEQISTIYAALNSPNIDINASITFSRFHRLESTMLMHSNLGKNLASRLSLNCKAMLL